MSRARSSASSSATKVGSSTMRAPQRCARADHTRSSCGSRSPRRRLEAAGVEHQRSRPLLTLLARHSSDRSAASPSSTMSFDRNARRQPSRTGPGCRSACCRPEQPHHLEAPAPASSFPMKTIGASQGDQQQDREAEIVCQSRSADDAEHLALAPSTVSPSTAWMSPAVARRSGPLDQEPGP